MNAARLYPARAHAPNTAAGQWSWYVIPLVIAGVFVVLAAFIAAMVGVSWLIRAGVGVVSPPAGAAPLGAYTAIVAGACLLTHAFWPTGRRVSAAARRPVVVRLMQGLIAIAMLIDGVIRLVSTAN